MRDRFGRRNVVLCFATADWVSLEPVIDRLEGAGWGVDLAPGLARDPLSIQAHIQRSPGALFVLVRTPRFPRDTADLVEDMLQGSEMISVRLSPSQPEAVVDWIMATAPGASAASRVERVRPSTAPMAARAAIEPLREFAWLGRWGLVAMSALLLLGATSVRARQPSEEAEARAEARSDAEADSVSSGVAWFHDTARRRSTSLTHRLARTPRDPQVRKASPRDRADEPLLEAAAWPISPIHSAAIVPLRTAPRGPIPLDELKQLETLALVSGKVVRSEGMMLLRPSRLRMDHAAATEHCSKLELYELDDWRLATIPELERTTGKDSGLRGRYWAASLDRSDEDPAFVRDGKKERTETRPRDWTGAGVVCARAMKTDASAH